MISRAVVRECMSALASFSNCRVRNQPCFFASSFAFFTIPVPRFGRRRENDFRAEKAHQPAALDAERFGHRDDQRIAFRRAHHREPDAGVAARRLDHRLSRLELARLLRVLDDAEREAILDGAERIERFDLDVEIEPCGASLLILTTGVLPTVSRMLANFVIGYSSSYITCRSDDIGHKGKPGDRVATKIDSADVRS